MIQKLSSILCLVWVLFSGLIADAQTLPMTPVLKKGVLSNGLTFYIYPNAYPKGEAVYRLFVKVGSVYETDEQRGLAHFLEHMAFNGTKHFPGSTMVDFLESKGAKFGKDLNAHTSFNETVYKLTLPTSNSGMVDSTLTILADWADGMLLDSVQVEKERGVVFSEWLSKTGSVQDAGNSLLLELLNQSRYSLRRPIGDTAVINGFKHEALKSFYKEWYRPDLMAVAVVGDVDPVEIEKAIRLKFGAIAKRKKQSLPQYQISTYRDTRAKIVYQPNLQKSTLNFIQLIPKKEAITTEKDYLAYLQRTFINRLFQSRFAAISFFNQSYEKGSASITNFINEKGMLYGAVDLSKDKIMEGIQAFGGHLEQMLQFGFTQSEIAKIEKILRKQLERSATVNGPRSSETLMNEIYAHFYANNAFVSPQTEFALYQKYASKIDSLSLVKEIHRTNAFPWHYLLTTPVKNVFESEVSFLKTMATIQQTPQQRYYKAVTAIQELMPKEPIAGRVVARRSLPNISGEELELSNGVRLVFKPLVSGKNRINLSAFKAGGLYALPSSDYLNGLFASNIISLSGLGQYTRDEVSNFLAGNSASARFLIEKTRSGIVGSSSLDDAETLFQLIYLKSAAARIDSSVFQQTKTLSIQATKNKNQTKETKFGDSLKIRLAAEDYVTDALTAQKIEKGVTLDRILPVYNRFFDNAAGYTYVLMSDTSLEYLLPFIETYIASIPADSLHKNLPYTYLGGTVNTQAAKYTANGGSGSRASVALYFQHTKPIENMAETELNNLVLEQIVKMRLNKIIREDLGWVYSISVNTSAALFPRALTRSSISFSCLPQNVNAIIEKIGEILKDIVEHPDGYETELKNVKQNLLKEMELNRQRDLFWSTQIRNTLFNKMENFNHIADYEKNVLAITMKGLSTLVTQNFNTQKMIQGVLLPGNSKP